MMHTTLEKDPITVPDGWSRDRDGTIHMTSRLAWVTYHRMVCDEIPSYAVNFVFEDGMEFVDWVDKNGIQVEPTPVEANVIF